MSITERVDVAYTPLVMRLSHFYKLDSGDGIAFDRLPFQQQQFHKGQTIVERGGLVDHVVLMISGWAARVRYTPDGFRQIVHVLLPGDLLVGDTPIMHRLDHQLVSLTPTVVRKIEPSELRKLFQEVPSLSAALWWASEQEEGMLREHIVRLGRRSALERTAHFLLELHRRLLIVQQATEDTFILPLNQTDISDALGLSLVHISRTLKSLRKMGLVDLRQSIIVLRDREKLAELCDFDLVHFHLDNGDSALARG